MKLVNFFANKNNVWTRIAIFKGKENEYIVLHSDVFPDSIKWTEKKYQIAIKQYRASKDWIEHSILQSDIRRLINKSLKEAK
jgi:NACalpha-BTF3-like transcription factor